MKTCSFFFFGGEFIEFIIWNLESNIQTLDPVLEGYLVLQQKNGLVTFSLNSSIDSNLFVRNESFNLGN